VKGKKTPFIVEINLVNEKSLDYTFFESDSLIRLSLRKVRRIKFAYDKKEKQEIVPFVPTRIKFHSTALLQSVFTGRQTQIGPNYMHRISSDTTNRTSIWVQLGGGYHKQHTFRRDTKGHYWELGARLELISRRDNNNCFHLGFDINQQWARGREFSRGSSGGISSSPNNVMEEGIIAIQIPIGYTHRGNNGLYISGGLEVTVFKEFFPAFNLSLGYCFFK
jgi:hypothetical protein